ncbi:S66 peptidase family protein [Fimbriimonas ginsengisoli]|uniref:Peptidase U61, LD-carboxypeptidase A n=1 Tax=Fimbriimonas ginsengisoli Gsoil 348 TaxID=661478 RepID=A0A068NTS1_FIMGI|nr:LD-carboxypeptidase [Fimbriimonas ginsengisoli]AIE86145.1 peptidase U61, LD-carboxypeptidase A [Fimbriimonas ginsengisoli Gsoil 348]
MPLRLLRPGDTVALVTPASPLSAEKLEFVTEVLVAEGYRVKVMPHALEVDDYLAGDDASRAKDLQEAFDDDEVGAVFCTRGGYGCARLLPHLDLDRIVGANKMLLGFSDVTTLHVALNRRGMPTVHSPMALTLFYPREPWVIESLRRVLRNDLTLPAEAPKPVTVVGGIAEGPVVGGCMCLLTDSIGTPEPLETEGKILLIEDVDEHPHRIDAMLTHLLNSGLAQRAAGFLVGEMTRTDERVDEAIGGKPWRTIFRERLGSLGKPMVTDFPLGHAKNMLTLPLGIRARLDATDGTLTYLEPLCA